MSEILAHAESAIDGGLPGDRDVRLMLAEDHYTTLPFIVYGLPIFESINVFFWIVQESEARVG
jgi:hypothetical protein